MMRPPTSDGRGESDVHDYNDAEIEPKRGHPEPIDRPDGEPEMRLPGADQGSGLPGTSDDNLPQRLGERLENGSSSSMATGEPDVLPDMEPPDTTM